MRSIIIFALLGFAAGKSIPVPQPAVDPRTLEEDYEDFFELLPKDEIRAIVRDHLANDTDLQQTIAWIFTDDCKESLLALEAIPEYITFLDYMYNSGLDVYYYINWVHDLIGLPELTVPSNETQTQRQTRSLITMLDEVMATFPTEELEALAEEKLNTSASFKEMYDRMVAPEFMQIVFNLLSVQEYLDLKQHFLDNGIDIDQLMKLLHVVIGLPYHGS